ncbi:MAG: amidase [Rhodospirillaceae bacterium]|nr:amidase [Rhodospirillaceae bacterium]|tara:strand:- start:591 stop:2051 length:1461 start_codon:yes stop_codon:yes gene_type:complete
MKYASLDLIKMTAGEIVSLLKKNVVSPIELLDALEQRINEVDKEVNSLPTLCFTRARSEADKLMQKPIEDRGILAGLPIAIKDLAPVKDVRSTWGSLIYKDFVPKRSDCLVENVETEGAIVYAKSNTPEFGAGANTFNEVFGATLNPWDTTKSCAGSSGGSAVALATGQAWIASGSDLGGSLRNPASFCSVVGLRPSPGRVAYGATGEGAFPADLFGIPGQPFSVAGPMARNVSDVALLLDAMVGHHPRDPISLPRTTTSYIDAVKSRTKPKKVAFSRDLGVTPVDPAVADICEKAAKRFEQLGCIVEEAHPDFSDVQDIFQTWRAMSFYVGKKSLLDTNKDLLKPEVVWNIEQAAEITVDDFARVELARARYLDRAVTFFEEYDLLLSPATIVPPYPVEQRFVAELGEHKFSNYVEWLSIAYAITITGHPALSVPAGFTKDGLPVGLQIVGGPRGEANLLSAANLYEEISDLKNLVPIIPKKSLT